MEKERLSEICDLVIGFYRVKKKFEKEFKHYQKQGKFNFKAIDEMEVDLYNLKNETHAVFRHDVESNGRVPEREDLFDLIISSIFHETLHLKEYIYTLQSYETRYISFADRKKNGRIDSIQDDFLKYSREIVREAKENLPRKTTELKSLLEDALSLMEGTLKKYRTGKRLMRVLYLERELLSSIYGENGLEYIYRIMYKGGVMEGYFRVGASFLKGGFYDFAMKAFEEALSGDGGSEQENELRQEIKKKCQLLQKKQLGDARVQKILARIG
jgi:hypothetical protein